jgi:hypothetical protein
MNQKVNAENFDVTNALAFGWRGMVGAWCADTIERLEGRRPDIELVLARLDAEPEFPARLRREAIRLARVGKSGAEREEAARAEADAQAIAARKALDSALSYPYGA